ncbi:MAG: PEP-CTERM sorting domain-containing protein [Sulfuriferula sp.]
MKAYQAMKLLGVAAVLALGVAGNASAVDITTPGGKFVITGLGSGTGTWYKVPAVPEAETWAMMAVGLGLVGMRLRRKDK